MKRAKARTKLKPKLQQGRVLTRPFNSGFLPAAWAYVHFGRARRTEDLERNPEGVVKQALNFLHLPEYKSVTYERFNGDPEPGVQMRHETRQRLQEYFQPYDARLAELLGCEVRW